MFLEQQIIILELFLKDVTEHSALITGIIKKIYILKWT